MTVKFSEQFMRALELGYLGDESLLRAAKVGDVDLRRRINPEDTMMGLRQKFADLPPKRRGHTLRLLSEIARNRSIAYALCIQETADFLEERVRRPGPFLN